MLLGLVYYLEKWLMPLILGDYILNSRGFPTGYRKLFLLGVGLKAASSPVYKPPSA
jgi:hypothetical protein